MLKLFPDFFNAPYNLSRLNYTLITLILKKGNSTKVSDYRPISFENGMIKLISKVLSIRLRAKINELVSKYQSAFIQGRVIFESFIAASEIVSFCHCTKTSDILYKIDFKKAFDNVS